jgi:hypothetical protein
MQLWEVFDRTDGILPDGCSLHLDDQQCFSFINELSSKLDVVPDSYEKELGLSFPVLVTDTIYIRMMLERNVRLSQSELNNLLLLEEIIVDYD